MTIYKYNDKENKKYIGAVIGERSHMWMDGMEDVFHKVYDAETDSIIEIQTDYYGSCGGNLMDTGADIDLDKETARKVLRVLKRDAINAYACEVASHKKRIVPGRRVRVIKGRKVKKGTELEVFWVGERPTYESRIYHTDATEVIAGCYDSNHNKVWIKVEYLENITPIATPNAHKRNQMIKNWVRNTANSNSHMGCNTMANILKIARG